MNKLKQLIALLLALMLLTACGTTTPAPTEAPAEETTLAAEAVTEPAAVDSLDPFESLRTGTPWIMSVLDGVVTPEITADLKDDFYLAVNHDYLANGSMTEGYSSGGTVTEIVAESEKAISALFENAPDDSDDPALSFYSLLMDWEGRNQVGLAPLEAKMAEINAITTIEELSDYFAAAPVTQHPVCPFAADITANPFESGWYIPCAEPCKLVVDPSEYQEVTETAQNTIDMYAALSQKMLGRLGYSEEAAKAITDHATEFESMLAQHMYTNVEVAASDFLERTKNFFTREEMLELAGNLPIVRIVEESRGFGTRNRWLSTNPGYIRYLNSIYTQENLGLFLDWLRSKTARYYCSVLDQESRQLFEEVREQYNGTPKDVDTLTAMRLTKQELPWYTAKLYCDTYFTQQDKDTIRSVVDEMIAAYEEMLLEENFISAETKAAAIEKLNSLTIRCLYPDDWSLNLNPHIVFKNKAQGGTLFEAFEQIQEAVVLWDQDQVDLPINLTKWQEGTHPTDVNACYSSDDNSINIYAAICRGGVYSPEMSKTEVLARIGAIIGHELTHAFDVNGSQFDSQGNYRDWWTETDKAEFSKRNEKLKEYLCSIQLWEGMNLRGEFMCGEACADMGAMQCALRIAKTIPDFDYDLFFRSYADMWMNKKNLFAVFEDMTNPHPPYYLRVNAVLQQYDEFLDFYGIQEGDGMYLAPENRVKIW